MQSQKYKNLNYRLLHFGTKATTLGHLGAVDVNDELKTHILSTFG